MKATVLVECKILVEVEYEGSLDALDFVIEENSCPGTGIVGAKIDDVMEEARTRSVCWACNFQGQNRIIAINGQPLRERACE